MTVGMLHTLHIIAWHYIAIQIVRTASGLLLSQLITIQTYLNIESTEICSRCPPNISTTQEILRYPHLISSTTSHCCDANISLHTVHVSSGSVGPSSPLPIVQQLRDLFKRNRLCQIQIHPTHERFVLIPRRCKPCQRNDRARLRLLRRLGNWRRR
jgi:hypothetical protein